MKKTAYLRLAGAAGAVLFSTLPIANAQTVTNFLPDSSQTPTNSSGTLVALGDSITFGYNLLDTKSNTVPSKSAFPTLIGTTLPESNTMNLGVPGLTSGGLLKALEAAQNGKTLAPSKSTAVLSDSQLLSQLKSATVITIDIGSNDLLGPAIQDGLLAGKLTYPLSSAEQTQFMNIISSFKTNIADIVAQIHTISPHAYIVLYNIYDPIPSSFGSLHTLAESLIGQENTIITGLATQGGLTIADAYTAFDGNQSTDVQSFDVHPTLAGQQALAKAGEAALKAEVTAWGKMNPAPKAPTNLQHTLVSTTGWKETWTGSSNAMSYNIYLGSKKLNNKPITGTSFMIDNQMASMSYKVTVEAVNAGGTSPLSVDSVTTDAPVSITTSGTLMDAVEGTSDSQSIKATGGSGSYTFSVTSGSLPKGLSLSPNGSFSGVPGSSGNYTFTVTAKDSMGDTAHKAMTLSVAQPAVTGFYSQTLTSHIIGQSGGNLSGTSNGTTVTLLVTSGTFSGLEQININTGSFSSNSLPSGDKLIAAFGVNFPSGVTPSNALVFTLKNSDITPKSKVYKIVNGKLVPISATVSTGQAVVSFTTDPSFVVLQPPAPSSTPTVPNATTPSTGFPAWNWIIGGSASVLLGGFASLMTWRRKQRTNQ